MQTSQQAFRVNDSVVAAELDDQMVLLNVDTGLYFGLDELGTTIWSLIATGRAESEIVAHILAEYEVQRFQVEQDVLEFIEQLTAKGLLLPESR